MTPRRAIRSPAPTWSASHASTILTRVLRRALEQIQQAEGPVVHLHVEGKLRTTVLGGLHEGLPPGVSPADNELGWIMALAKLAARVKGS